MQPFPKITVTALKGLACGDAFGAPFEYNKKAPAMALLSVQEQRYLDNTVDVKVRPQWARMPGVYTDDGQQALILLHAWNAATDPLDADEVASLFTDTCVEMWDACPPREKGWACSFGLHRGTGGNFRTAIETGKPPDTAGLGGAMRIGPVATLLPDPETLVPWVVRVTQETTSHPLGLAGAVIFALACWRTAHYPWHLPTDKARKEAWDAFMEGRKAIQRPPEIPQDIWGLMIHACGVMKNGEKALVQLGKDSGLSHKPFSNAANGFALTGVPWALYHGLKGTSYTEALVDVCSSGGDTDTVGAMAGCLAALRLGEDSIPKWMTQSLLGMEVIENPHTWVPMEHERFITELEEKHWVTVMTAHAKKVQEMEARAKAARGKGKRKKKQR